MAEKTRYSDAELEEFRAVIMEKLELAKSDYEQLKMSLMGLDGNDTDYRPLWYVLRIKLMAFAVKLEN